MNERTESGPSSLPITLCQQTNRAPQSITSSS